MTEKKPIPDLTEAEIKELKRRSKDHENLVRYVICFEIIPKGRWRLFLNVSDDTWSEDLARATLFKRKDAAETVLENDSDYSPENHFLVKVTTKGGKIKTLKYFRQ